MHKIYKFLISKLITLFKRNTEEIIFFQIVSVLCIDFEEFLPFFKVNANVRFSG